MRSNLIEAVMGAVVLAVAAFFLAFAYSTADIGTVEGYEITARFDRADGIGPGTEVRMSGVKVGAVTALSLDPESYLALVRMTVKQDLRIPDDTAISVARDGLLGDSFLNLSPGGSDDMLAAGGEIEATQGSVDLISLLGRRVFGGTKGNAKPE